MSSLRSSRSAANATLIVAAASPPTFIRPDGRRVGEKFRGFLAEKGQQQDTGQHANGVADEKASPGHADDSAGDIHHREGRHGNVPQHHHAQHAEIGQTLLELVRGLFRHEGPEPPRRESADGETEVGRCRDTHERQWYRPHSRKERTRSRDDYRQWEANGRQYDEYEAHAQHAQGARLHTLQVSTERLQVHRLPQGRDGPEQQHGRGNTQARQQLPLPFQQADRYGQLADGIVSRAG